MAIDEIRIRGVRGIGDEITLKPGGASFLLHGDNGTGKSSVERGLRWALAGQEEPTAEKSFTSESSYRRNVLVEPTFPRVVVTFADIDKSSVTVTPGAVECTGNGANYRAACRASLPFLRRTELLDVLASRPADRFQYFESFLGLEPVDDVLSGLTTRRASLERRQSEIRTDFEATLASLSPLLTSGGGASPNSVHELENQAARVAVETKLVPQGTSWASLKTRAPELLSLSQTGKLDERRMVLQQLLEEWARFRAAGSVKPSLSDLESKRKDLEVRTVDSELAPIIQHALAHFRSREGQTCPICEQPVNWAATRHRLEERQRTLAEYSEVLDSIRQGASAWRTLWTNFEGLLARLCELLEIEPEKRYTTLTPIPAGLDLLSGLEQMSDGAAANALIAVGTLALDAFMVEASSRASELIEQALVTLPAPQSLSDLRLILSFIQRFEEKRQALEASEQELERLDGRLKYVTEICEAIRHARQDIAKETLAAIGNRVADYYFAIHPKNNADEATGPPSIDVQRHKAGTAFVRGEFFGKNVKDPQWVYSDGHLDTVGICVFLAIRRYRGDEPDDPKLLILDDIVISIDLGHARRLIDLLGTEFADHQMFILTHNGLFAHWCASLMPGLRRTQIKNWTLEGGPRIGEYLQAKERLRAKIGDGSPKEIALELMAFMDEWLGEARYAYAVAVPAKYGEQYTLTEIWEPFGKTIKKMETALGSRVGKATESLARLKDLPAIRNALPAHDNDFAKEYPREVVVEVAGQALEFVGQLYCDLCKSFAAPTPNRFSPVMVHCRCHAIQYAKPPKATQGQAPSE